MKFGQLILSISLLALTACGGETKTVGSTTEVVSSSTKDTINTEILAEILAAQPVEVKARYKYRHPAQTLNFFGIRPGMTVAEVLPGTGWYSKILLPYLGPEGQFIGVDYSVDMWSKLGGPGNEEFLNNRKNWPQTFPREVSSWGIENGADVTAFTFESRPESLNGQVDVVLIVRAMHHLNRWDRAHWEKALSDTYAILKPGGLVGIVQHRAPESNPDAWANGDKGYLKESFVKASMETAGFVLVRESDVNANPKDQPTTEDFVWRLPPTLSSSRDNADLKAKMEAIGESDRMTLLYKKNGQN